MGSPLDANKRNERIVHSTFERNKVIAYLKEGGERERERRKGMVLVIGRANLCCIFALYFSFPLFAYIHSSLIVPFSLRSFIYNPPNTQVILSD